MTDAISFGLEILAVGIGVFGGLLANIFLQKWLEKRQSIRVLKLLKGELEINLNIIRNAIKPIVSGTNVPYAHLELGIWEAVSNKIDLITTDKTLQSIAKAYYQFDTLENALQTYESHATAWISESNPRVKAQLSRQVIADRDVILKHLSETGSDERPTVISITNRAIADVGNEIRRLDC